MKKEAGFDFIKTSFQIVCFSAIFTGLLGSCDNNTNDTEKHSHSWDEGKVILEENEEHHGWKLYTCIECGGQKAKMIGAPTPNGPLLGNDGGGGSPSLPAHGSVVDYAVSRLSCPYVWGAAGPDSFDNSGLVVWCYSQIGISLSHYSEKMLSCAKKTISPSQAKLGDVLYRPGHVAISTGGTNFIHAPHAGAVVSYGSSTNWTYALQF